MNRPILAVVLGTAASMTDAQPETQLNAFPEAPSIPSAVYQGETVEPEITIVETEKELIYEYRVRGKLYMVKIQPQIGPPYYLMDTTGDGELDVREDRVWNNSIPQWVLFSW